MGSIPVGSTTKNTEKYLGIFLRPFVSIEPIVRARAQPDALPSCVANSQREATAFDLRF